MGDMGDIEHPTPVPVPIDLAAWSRREHFEHYLRRVPCTYAMTVELDATVFAAALRESPRKTYLAQIWALATVVNAHEEFRMRLAEGRDGPRIPAIWPVVHPMFTVFNPARETFCAVWAPYDSDFGAFHDAAAPLLAEHAAATELFPQGAPPPNVFDVSSIPWASFTGFALDIAENWEHLAPIFTLGKYAEREGRLMLPLAIQVHHAVADGFHTARLIDELQALLADPVWIA